MFKPVVTTAKRVIKRMLIAAGIMNPAAKNRHGLVGRRVELVDVKRKFQISFLRSQGLLPHHRVLDLGCGTLRGGVAIIDYLERGNYTGLDVRRRVLEEAQKELVEHGLEKKEPLLMELKNAVKALGNRQYDFVWAFSVLIHMSDSVLRNMLEFVSRHMKDDGVFYANVRIGEDDDGEWQGFPVVTRTLAFYEREAERHGLVIKNLGSMASLGDEPDHTGHDRQYMMQFVRR